MIKNIINSLKNTKILFIILLCLNLFVVLYHFSNKQGFHSDEQWSYAHANSSIGAYLDKEIDSFYRVTKGVKQRLFNQFLNTDILNNYLTVQKDNIFSYYNIYNNLEVVEHPPLYFILLHTISSFDVENFSKWHAGILNFILFILIYVVLFKLANQLLKDEKLALCCVALWGFSEIGIDTVIFLRMYILQTLLCICLVYETLKILDKNSAESKDLMLVFIYSFLGIFNQYNSIFFSFFVTLVTFIILLKRKNYSLLIKYCLVMLLSFLMLFVIFPQAYDVLFNSLRAKQVMSFATAQYTDNSSNVILEVLFVIEQRLTNIFSVLFQNFLSFNDTNFKMVTFVIIIGIFTKWYMNLKINKNTTYLIWITFLYFIYLLSMPYMHIFHSRYYMCLMPFYSILLVILLKEVFVYIKIKRQMGIAILTILILFNFLHMDFNKNSSYAFMWGESEHKIYNKIKNKNVFIDKGYNFIWLHSMVYFLMETKSVFITEEICHSEPLSNIKNTINPIVFTYASYIRSDFDGYDNKCLEDIGLIKTTKVCASQHCYDVWEK